METILIIAATSLISSAIFIPTGMILRKKIAESKIQGAEKEADRLKENAKIEANRLKENAKIETEKELVKAKEEVFQIKNDLEKEIKERRSDIQSQEKRLVQKEENLEKRITVLDTKEKEIERKFAENEEIKQELKTLHDKQLEELQRISRLTTEQAKQQLLNDLEKEITEEKADKIKELENKAKEESVKNAREIVSLAIQKCAADHTSETTVSVVSLPNDEMKGRIIGREGRNIKTLETLTGIDLIIDDTPEAVIISGFDPLRREVAKIAIEKLIDDRKNPSCKNRRIS